MSDLVPDTQDAATYSGPYGQYPVHRHGAPEPNPTSDLIARLREEVRAVRHANELYARERIMVEQVIGRLIPAGELAPAVKMAIYRERGP